jgi:hypothetical protein
VRAALFHFLEAQGLDTSGLGAMDLDRYLTGDPVWFRKGSTVVRVPLAGLSKAGAGFKAPPAEVGAAVLRQAGRGGGGLELPCWQRRCPLADLPALCRLYNGPGGSLTALTAL